LSYCDGFGLNVARNEKNQFFSWKELNSITEHYLEFEYDQIKQYQMIKPISPFAKQFDRALVLTTNGDVYELFHFSF
jgi:hypothetical protein